MLEIADLEIQVRVDIYALIAMCGLVPVCFDGWLIVAFRKKWKKTNLICISSLTMLISVIHLLRATLQSGKPFLKISCDAEDRVVHIHGANKVLIKFNPIFEDICHDAL